jgi:hypothetical protein
MAQDGREDAFRVWQMPVALISTSTSPNFGPCRSTFSIVRGWPDFQATAALVFMVKGLS